MLSQLDGNNHPDKTINNITELSHQVQVKVNKPKANTPTAMINANKKKSAKSKTLVYDLGY